MSKIGKFEGGNLAYYFVGLGFVIGVAFGLSRAKEYSVAEALKGGMIGLWIALSCALAKIIVSEPLKKCSFIVSALVYSAIFTTLALAIPPVGHWMEKRTFAGAYDSQGQVAAIIVVTLIGSLLATFCVTMRRAVGPEVFSSLLTGRYRTPAEETRLFLLADLEMGSEIAAKLGPVKFHQFIDQCWRDMSASVLEWRGEIHKYVGNGMVVSWLLKEAKLEGSWVDCAIEMRAALEKNRRDFEKRFGVFPHFRMALHCGEVVTGELGWYRTEIRFLGETMEVATKILEKGQKHQIDLLASQKVIDRSPVESLRYRFVQRPELLVGGKTGEVQLFEVQTA